MSDSPPKSKKSKAAKAAKAKAPKVAATDPAPAATSSDDAVRAVRIAIGDGDSGGDGDAKPDVPATAAAAATTTAISAAPNRAAATATARADSDGISGVVEVHPSPYAPSPVVVVPIGGAGGGSKGSSGGGGGGGGGGDGSGEDDESRPLIGVVSSALNRLKSGIAVDPNWLDDAVPSDKASLYLYYSIACVAQWLVSRFVTLALLLLGDRQWLGRSASSFLGLEIALTAYYWHERRYFPGSVYTDLHCLLYGRILRPTYLHNRFTPGFRFVFGTWGYFLVAGVLLNVEQWGDSDSLFLRISSFVILIISIKQIVLYAPVILIWYISLVLSLYYFLCCWWLCVGTEHVPLFQDVTDDQWSFPVYKFIFEHV